ncbi:MAG: rhodanese-like domain-containing protein [Saprospiraceae bacterium]|nr:rhodanese-like domain-containing protein [Bacteroidia bacterium]NNE14790.1 rhodanese-like domain-containing protein [Saprospiraceae bacterium]NNL93447.1 rhodanese-like domain-containing protein [Saprospiraceae bacterium]
MRHIILISVFLISVIACKEEKKQETQAAEPVKKVVSDNEIPPQNRIKGTDIKQVTVHEAKKLGSEGYQFLDVRTEEEIARGKIEGAIEMSVKAYDFQHKVNQMDRDIKLIVYCSAGNRSALAAKLFGILEFTNVVEMPGGYSEWRTTFK